MAVVIGHITGQLVDKEGDLELSESLPKPP